MGFHLLNRLRRRFPQVRSVMMNPATLARHEHWAIKCSAPSLDETDLLNAEERSACTELRVRGLRLEQEKLPYQYTVEMLNATST
jgi:hypothetical protein